MKIRKIAFCLATFFLLSPVLGAEELGTIYSKGAVLIEKDSKRILYERHANEEMPMASTTKIMTCIIALENNALDEVVTASSRAAKAPKVKLGLQVDEKQTLGDLLYSLMLESHNDSAVAIAEHVGGTVEQFCVMMTEKAHELGATHTCFETPNGLDSENHYSTPYDMAVIAAYAVDNPKFIEITNTLEKQIPTEPLEGSKTHSLINKNRFIREYNGAIGVKTGFTGKAGHCFVGAVDKNNMTLIGGALGAGNDSNAKVRKYTDVKKMMNFGYSNFAKYRIIQEGLEAGSVQVENGKQDTISACYEEEVILPLSKQEKDTIKIKVNLPEKIQAPVVKEQVLGEAEILCNNQVIDTLQVVAKEDIAEATLMDQLKKKWQHFKNKMQ